MKIYKVFYSVWPKTNDSVHELRTDRKLIDVYSLFTIAPWWATSRMQVFKHFHVLFVRPGSYIYGFFTMIVEQCDIQACYSALLAEKARICFFIVKHADVSESHLYHLISTIK